MKAVKPTSIQLKLKKKNEYLIILINNLIYLTCEVARRVIFFIGLHKPEIRNYCLL